MAAIVRLACPFQRAALLVARWCGARRGEIQRLALDCLDRYPDGTPRLGLPAGKTYRERLVPLHEEAATALRDLIALRANAPERAFTDELTGTPARYLFMQRGKLLSTHYLFEAPIQQACTLRRPPQSCELPSGTGVRRSAGRQQRRTPSKGATSGSGVR